MSEIDYEAVLNDLERRRAELDVAIRAIRLIIGADIDSVSAPIEPKPSATNAKAPASHAFFGMSIGTAAKKYLEMAKEPKKAIEIAKALKKGGLINMSPNFPATVSTTLRREKAVIQLPDKRWGLAEWFPAGAKSKGASKANGSAATLPDADPSEPELLS